MSGKLFVAAGIMLAIAMGTSWAQMILRHPEEIILNVADGAPYQRLIFTTRPERGSPVWDRAGLITNDPEFVTPSDIEVTLDEHGKYTEPIVGWSTSGQDGQVALGRAMYAVAMGTERELNGSRLEIDCYGTRQVLIGDIVVTYHVRGNFFEPSSVDCFDGPEGLQPTPPRDFRCTNVGQQGQHPHLAWTAPAAPAGVAFLYRVYRRCPWCAWECVASGLTATEWTDHEVVIWPGSGVTFYYRATAYTSQSPESDYSEEVAVHGFLVKPVPERETSHAAPVKSALWVYPNPCNPVATVRYMVPEEGQVKVSLYDLCGEEVAELARGRHAAGEYLACLDGRPLASGVYLVRMVCGGHALSAKVLVVK